MSLARRRIGTTLLFAVLVAVAGVGTSAAIDRAGVRKSKIIVGHIVTNVAVQILEGKSVKLTELQKDAKRSKSGVIALSFWCTTYSSCRGMEHQLASLSKKYEGRAAVFALAASTDETAS
jgi:hypothetical protein